MGGKAWVCAVGVEKVEIDHVLVNETILLLGDKVEFARGKSFAKIIFECADRTFGGVAAVGVQGNKLEVNIVLAEGFLHDVVALVVKDVDSGGCTVL